jgi:hypothetical protein
LNLCNNPSAISSLASKSCSPPRGQLPFLASNGFGIGRTGYGPCGLSTTIAPNVNVTIESTHRLPYFSKHHQFVANKTDIGPQAVKGGLEMGQCFLFPIDLFELLSLLSELDGLVYEPDKSLLRTYRQVTRDVGRAYRDVERF